MVNIDTVYQRVLALANKEQRGYITPQEFNLFANQAQIEIFEQYFYDLNQSTKIPGNDYYFADIDDLIEEVGVENITIKDLEAMGYEIDRLPMSVQRKLGIQKPVSNIDRALKKSDDDLPDLPF